MIAATIDGRPVSRIELVRDTQGTLRAGFTAAGTPNVGRPEGPHGLVTALQVARLATSVGSAALSGASAVGLVSTAGGGMAAALGSSGSAAAAFTGGAGAGAYATGSAAVAAASTTAAAAATVLSIVSVALLPAAVGMLVTQYGNMLLGVEPQAGLKAGIAFTQKSVDIAKQIANALARVTDGRSLYAAMVTPITGANSISGSLTVGQALRGAAEAIYYGELLDWWDPATEPDLGGVIAYVMRTDQPDPPLLLWSAHQHDAGTGTVRGSYAVLVTATGGRVTGGGNFAATIAKAEDAWRGIFRAAAQLVDALTDTTALPTPTREQVGQWNWEWWRSTQAGTYDPTGLAGAAQRGDLAAVVTELSRQRELGPREQRIVEYAAAQGITAGPLTTAGFAAMPGDVSEAAEASRVAEWAAMYSQGGA